MSDEEQVTAPEPTDRDRRRAAATEAFASAPPDQEVIDLMEVLRAHLRAGRPV